MNLEERTRQLKVGLGLAEYVHKAVSRWTPRSSEEIYRLVLDDYGTISKRRVLLALRALRECQKIQPEVVDPLIPTLIGYRKCDEL